MTSKKAAVTAKATKAASRGKTGRKRMSPRPPRPRPPSQASCRRPGRPAKKAAAGPVAPPALASKQAQLIALLRSAEGATLAQMMARTGWQAHTVRGTISGVLRKRLGLVVECVAPIGDGPRVYRIVEPVAA